MSKEEVHRLCEAMDVAELDAYRAAVTDRTEASVNALPTAELDRELARDQLRQVFVTEEAGGAGADGIVEAYDGHTKGWLLGHLVLTHHFYHIGNAFGVRSLFGLGNPW